MRRCGHAEGIAHRPRPGTARRRRHLPARSGRAADTVFGGHEKVLRQTVIGMAQGTVMAADESPGDATVYVLSGRVRMASGGAEWEGTPGDLLTVPDAPHSLDGIEDSAVLLTVGRRG